MATQIAAPGYLLSNRSVYTYAPHERALGVLTGYPLTPEAFVVEHVILFPSDSGGALLGMLRAGFEEAWDRGYRHILFCLPRPALGRFARLERLARRFECTPYAETEDLTWWVRWRDGQ